MKDNIFKNVLFNKVGSNRFDLSHDVKLSFQMGELVPTCIMEAVPGDQFNLSVENMLRFAPLISPVMHKVNVTTHYFFVPNRILWSEWEKWITGDSDVEAPYFMLSSVPGGLDVGSIGDYLGMPTGDLFTDIKVSPFTIAAYMKVFDEFYRDQNLQDEVFDPLVAGSNGGYVTHVNQTPFRRAWMHDYFTSCLPFAQKGDAVQIPLVTQDKVPVEQDLAWMATHKQLITKSDGSPNAGLSGFQSSNPQGAFEGNDNSDAYLNPNGTLTVDVQADATDINTLRRAFRLQEWLERNARGGTRYIENILAHFGVKSSDARLQRPEYIGGSKQNMIISEVLSTAESVTTPVGQMAGHGISVGGGNQFSYRCEEHGVVIGIVSVMPVTAYQQGLHKSLTRFDRLDYAWPSFANLGEQEVLLKELYANTANDPEAIFGYIPRYSEYKFMNSRVAGEMRDTLAFWHLGRIFADDPALNEDFIKCTPSARIFAVTDPDEDHIFAHIFNNVSVRRKLPRYGIPTI